MEQALPGESALIVSPIEVVINLVCFLRVVGLTILKGLIVASIIVNMDSLKF